MSAEERWLPVVGWEQYYVVSNYGRIRSLRSMKMRKLTNPSNGYLNVILSLCGKAKNVLIHRAVAQAFLPTDSDGMEVNHKDGNKHNNAVANLEWVTRSENSVHAFSLGLRKPRRKLTESDARTIRVLRRYGVTNLSLSRIYSVCPSAVVHVVKGRTFAGSI